MTFSIEIEPDYTDVVLLDPTGNDNDVIVTLDEGGDVWIRHQCPETDKVDLILMTYSMLTDLIEAMNKPEGVYTDVSDTVPDE